MKKILLSGMLVVVMCPQAWAQYNQENGVSASEADSTPAPVPSNPSYPWGATSSVTYATGDFGTGTTTDTVYIPVTVSRYFSQGKLDLTIPYAYKKSGPGVTLINGRGVRTSHATDGTTTSSGLGDILLKGSYYLLQETDSKPFNMSLIDQVKLPTADDKKGLGTGKFDDTIGTELSKSLGDYWQVFSNLYYTFVGSPNGEDLKNQFTYDVGAGYKVTSQIWAHLYYEESTAIISDTSNPRTLFIGGDYQLTPPVDIFSDLGIGLSEGSPDISISFGAGIKF
ncbi:MAG: transporter [Candidatus Omnitrophica bacterium]|nr:transporter [Candidatus Omnitrophota bacterium]